MEPKVPSLLHSLLVRLNHVVNKVSNSWAGCSSDDSLGNSEEPLQAYVVEPGGIVRNSKEIRALLLVLSKESDDSSRTGIFQHLLSIKEFCDSKKEPIFLKLSIALSFLIDRRFEDVELRNLAVQRILNFKNRSYYGNDEERGTRLISRFKLFVRALQHSKVRLLGVPKRPKERAEPTHEWLPSWQQQFDRNNSSFEEEEDHISDLLSPSEVAFHFGR